MRDWFGKMGWLAVTGFLVTFTTSAKADTYTYDAYGRLLSVTFTAGGSITYTYDDAGNRITQVKQP